MATPLHQALRSATPSKLSAQELAFVNAHYQRFGDTQEERVAAYQRRRARSAYAKLKWGVDNFTLRDASGQQVHSLARQGLIGTPGGGLVGQQDVRPRQVTGPGLTGTPGPVMAAPTPAGPLPAAAATGAPVQSAPGLQVPAGVSMSALLRRRRQSNSYGSY